MGAAAVWKKTAFHIGMEGKPLFLYPPHPKAVKEVRSEIAQTWDLSNCWSFMSTSRATSSHSANPCLSEERPEGQLLTIRCSKKAE